MQDYSAYFGPYFILNSFYLILLHAVVFYPMVMEVLYGDNFWIIYTRSVPTTDARCMMNAEIHTAIQSCLNVI